MSQLSQLQLRFSPEEDRLLLRLNTDDRQEYRLWLTRRLVKLLWPVLVQTLESDALVQAQSDPDAKKAVVAFQQETALAQADFQTAFQEDAEDLPLGDAPLLITRVQVKAGPGGGRTVSFLPNHGQGANVVFDVPTLHAFSRLLLNAAKRADWSLTLNLPKSEAGPDDPQIRFN